VPSARAARTDCTTSARVNGAAGAWSAKTALPTRASAVTRAGERVDLSVKEYALLDYFVRHAGEMCSRTLIAENIWDMNFDSDTNVVDVAVRRLRAKLDDPCEIKLIHTIRGVGYVFGARNE